MARLYSVWNATVAALQFWTADLEAHVLSSTIEQVYNAFFYSTSMYLLCQQSDEILFSCFMTTLNAFKSKLALKDESYESGSENFNIPTPLRRTSKIHYVSSAKYASFDPNPITPCSTGTKEPHCRLIHQCLTFSSSEEDEEGTPIDEFPSPDSPQPMQYHTDTLWQPSSMYTLNMHVILEEEEEEEEDFQTVSLDDEHRDVEEIPDRPLYIHEHSLPNGLCPYPCPYSDYQTTSYYDTLDLSDISEFEDLMTTSSDEDIPALNDIGY